MRDVNLYTRASINEAEQSRRLAFFGADCSGISSVSARPPLRIGHRSTSFSLVDIHAFFPTDADKAPLVVGPAGSGCTDIERKNVRAIRFPLEGDSLPSPLLVSFTSGTFPSSFEFELAQSNELTVDLRVCYHV